MPRTHFHRTVIIGSGHNALIAGAILARSGVWVTVLESLDVVGGACRTEYPFAKAPGVGCSTGAYLLGPMPPEVLRASGLEGRIRLIPRRPHGYFLNEHDQPVAFGVVGGDQFVSDHDKSALDALDHLLRRIADDVGPLWLKRGVTLEDAINTVSDEPARSPLQGTVREHFAALMGHAGNNDDPRAGSVGALLEKLKLDSPMLAATIATDGLVGSARGIDDPGTGANFIVHNMLRLPPGDAPSTSTPTTPLGSWQLVEGGMGSITQTLKTIIEEHSGEVRTRAPVSKILSDRPFELDGKVTGVQLETGEIIEADEVIVGTDPRVAVRLLGLAVGADASPKCQPSDLRGTSLKVNLAIKRLPRVRGVEHFSSEVSRMNMLRGTIHVLPTSQTFARLEMARFAAVERGKLPNPEDCMIDVYTHTASDPSLCDSPGEGGRHAMSLFVQWVPANLSAADAQAFAHSLIRGPVAKVLPELPELIEDMLVLGPQQIQERLGITGGHIHHADNALAFADRDHQPFATTIARIGVPICCGSGFFPAGSVIGCSGFLAAQSILKRKKHIFDRE